MRRVTCDNSVQPWPGRFGRRPSFANGASRHVPACWTGFYFGGELRCIQTDPEYTGALLLGAPFIVTSGFDKNGLTYGILARTLSD
jgi:hypothetical protein